MPGLRTANPVTAEAADRLARLGRSVKKMSGGIEGWRDEGFALTTPA